MIPGEGFDIAFSNYVLHWVEDKKKAFENVFHCLKASGQFAACIEMKFLPDLEDFVNLMDASSANKVKSSMHFLSTDEIEKIASAHGFTVQYKEEFDRACKFDSVDECIKFMYGSFKGLVDTQLMNTERLQKFKHEQDFKAEEEFGVVSSVFYIFRKN